MTQLQNVGSYTFTSADKGRKTYPFNYANAASNVRVRLTDNSSPAIVSCSTDNFAIRPANLAVSASDADWVSAGTTRSLNNNSATGGNVHKAGQAFTITATAYNAAGTPAITTRYNGNPTVKTLACTLPAATCTSGTLSPGIWSGSSGTMTTSSANYAEAGSYTLTLEDQTFANVDSADSSLLERTIPQATAIAVGRFVPDHFDLTTNNTPLLKTFNDTTCTSRSFTYIGQSFGYTTAPQALITAKNASGATTTNYSGTLWHNPSPTAVYASTINTLNTSLTSIPSVVANNNGTGTAIVNATDLLAYPRNATTPQNTFNAGISLTLSAADSSEAAVSGNGTINTVTGAVFNGSGSGIAFDAGNAFRYGRLILNNASGVETLNLPINMEAQYWNGINFVTNTADNCSTIIATNIAMGNYTKNLAACETASSVSGRLNSGKSNLKLLKPGSGNNGSVDLTVNLGTTATGQTCSAPLPATQQNTTTAAQSYLQGKWSGSNYDKNPTARATFGIYKNANEFIYMREMY